MQAGGGGGHLSPAGGHPGNGRLISRAAAWSRATVLWPCGHADDLELTWLPDQRLRRRRAVETSLYSTCFQCLPALEAARSHIALGGRTEFDTETWRGVTTISGDTVDAGTRAVVGGSGSVRSWGEVLAIPGGCVAAASGSRTELAGGRAAVSDGGLLVARSGWAVVDAGARVLLARDAHEVKVWALPWARVQVGAHAHLVLDKPWGRVLDAAGNLSPGAGSPPQELMNLLESSRAMGPR